MGNDMTGARAGRARAAANRKRTIAEEVEAILVDPGVNRELKYKLSYCQSEIDRGRGDSSLTDQRRRFIEEARRMKP